jgi:hypothetical protein
VRLEERSSLFSVPTGKSYGSSSIRTGYNIAICWTVRNRGCGIHLLRRCA